MEVCKIKIKKSISALLVAVISVNMFVGSLASDSPKLLDVSKLSTEERKEISQEINAYISDELTPVEMIASANTYYIPLSNGEFVKVETIMERMPSDIRNSEIIDANLGGWRYGVKYTLAQGWVDIYINYHVNSTVHSDGYLDMEMVSSGIEGKPAQFTSVDDEQITDEISSSVSCYAEGYVTFGAAGFIPVNVYADLRIREASNNPSHANYGKLLTIYNFYI